MEYVAIVTALALLEYTVFAFMTGAARARTKVLAPATTGNPEFERYFRVQQNTIEQLITFLPALWLFGLYVSAPIGALLGLVFVLGRLLYALAYWRDAEKRGLGFLIGELANVALILGALAGAIRAVF